MLSGLVTITGPGTTVTLSEAFGHFEAPFELEGGWLRVARNDGDVGDLNVENGAVVNVTSGAGSSSPALTIGHGPGSIGTMRVNNAAVKALWRSRTMAA